MSNNVQPTPIVDKNGKQTTVHKKTGPDIKDSRVNKLTSQKKAPERTGMPFPDDPHDTATESIEEMTSAIRSLTEIMASTEDPSRIMDLAEKAYAVADSRKLWKETMGKHKYLAEARDELTSTLNLLDSDAITSISEPMKQGYKLAAERINRVRPEAPKTTFGNAS
jgi:hypothetical protein